MFINKMIIAIFFRLCNFGLVIALAAYAFKKYVLPNIIINMSKKEAEKDFFLSQQDLLEQKQRELDILMQQDIILGEHLKIKVNEWKKAVEEKCFLQKKEHVKRCAELDEKYNQKKEWQRTITLQRLTKDRVVDALQKSLSSHFDNKGVGTEYLDRIVLFMHERKL